MVVKSFIQHLKSVGEFDGQEKFDKVLDQFTYKKDGKRKSADHLYEDINRSWKSWINGEFEVDGELVDQCVYHENTEDDELT